MTLAPARARPERLLRSAGFRFAALFALFFSLGAAALIGFVWWASTGALGRQTDTAIRADLLVLTDRWRDGGVPALLTAVTERLAEDVEDESIYFVTDAAQHRLGGNLDRWPDPARTRGLSWFDAVVDHGGAPTRARLAHATLPDGTQLLVGRDVTERQELGTLLGEAVLWSLGLLVVIAVAGGWLVRRMLERRLAPVAHTAVRFAAGELTHRIPVTAEGDEFDRLARTLNAMLDRIVELMSGVRDVSDAIAHDLRTPIARARARLEDALALRDDDLRPAIERAIADLDGIVAIFEALLRIAEIEAGARRAAFTDSDLAPVLADLAETYAVLAEPRRIRVDARLPQVLPFHGDRDLLAQAVANLLDNAVKFSSEGSAIRLSAEMREDRLHIAVADRGPGLPPGMRDRARERFWRGEEARHTPGSGLGLSLVDAVAKLHGGAFRLADNDPGLVARLVIPGG